MQETLDIVELIENNPISKLSSTYNNKLLIKIEEAFTNFEQQLFISSFYCYLNYDKSRDFVVDLNNIWRWLGFTQKYNAERMLELNFKIGIDYNKLAPHFGGASSEQKQHGGHNKQIVMMTIKCFKSLCLKAQTKKATEIHDYYLKLEEILHDISNEESIELRQQLQIKDKQLEQKEKESKRAIEQAIINQFPLNTECIYFGTIENTNDAQEKLIKFGHTNNLASRVLDHRKSYTNFNLTEAFRVHNKVEIENLIKTHAIIKRQIRNIEVNGKLKTEIIAYNETHFTINKLTNLIQEIIRTRMYSAENFDRLMQENIFLMQKNEQIIIANEQLTQQLTNAHNDIEKLKEQNFKQTEILTTIELENKSVYNNNPILENNMTCKFNEFIETMCIVRYNVEESSSNMEGQFRIWLKEKPKKETFHAFKQYLDTRFRPARLSNQLEGHVLYGYIGVKLKPIEYVKKYIDNDIETFLFQVCRFSPTGKMLNSELLTEYKKWKIKINKPILDDDMKELKKYLNYCKHTIKSTVWTNNESNEGYYGISLRSEEYKPKYASTTGKKIEKIEVLTGVILETWDTIAKAAISEGISAAKMSRSVKNVVTFKDYYYRVKS